MLVNSLPLVRGLASYVLPTSLFRRAGSGGTFSSSYCYSVWLRHLVSLKNNGLLAHTNELSKVAEIGPGDSLGIGLAALYTGANHYYAFDVIRHTKLSGNLPINNDLRDYFLQRLEIPHGTHAFRNTNPVLPNYVFPHEFLPITDELIHDKHQQISKVLMNQSTRDVSIRYIVPWMGVDQTEVRDLDLIFSQAVMEHVDGIEYAYCEMYKWLRKGGLLSHQVDFKAHEMTTPWNGHWFIGPGMWKVLAHGRKYPMNRLPLSAHVEAIKKAGFEIKVILPVKTGNPYSGHTPQVPGVVFTEEDLATSSALIQAVKR